MHHVLLEDMSGAQHGEAKGLAKPRGVAWYDDCDLKGLKAPALRPHHTVGFSSIRPLS